MRNEHWKEAHPPASEKDDLKVTRNPSLVFVNFLSQQGFLVALMTPQAAALGGINDLDHSITEGTC